MTRIALDTSTEAFSVAVEHGSQIIEHYELAPRQHGDKLLPSLDGLLKKLEVSMSDVSQVVFGQGPGGFTGVRIAVAAAQGLAFGIDANLLGVSSLQNIAFQAALARTEVALSVSRVVCAMDARMGEVYFAEFKIDEDGFPSLCGMEQVCHPSEVNSSEGSEPFVAVGSGWGVYESELCEALSGGPVHLFVDVFPGAKAALQLSRCSQFVGEAVAPELAVPVYLRNQVAKKSQKSI